MEKELKTNEAPKKAKDYTDPLIVSMDEVYGVYREASKKELIVDLRPRDDYDKKHIEDSLSIPAHKALRTSYDLSKKERVYLVCQDGKESTRLAPKFAELYPKTMFYYTPIGGFAEWVKKNYPVVSQDAKNLREGVELSSEEMNEPDYRKIVKGTRILPPEMHQKMRTLLPEGYMYAYFADKNRSCYVFYFKKERRSLTINPLIEVHHHFIDQTVRNFCEFTTCLYFESTEFANSPKPHEHAEDFNKLTNAQTLKASRFALPELEKWFAKVDYQQTENGGEILVLDRLAITSKVDKLPASLQNQIELILPVDKAFFASEDDNQSSSEQHN